MPPKEGQRPAPGARETPLLSRPTLSGQGLFIRLPGAGLKIRYTFLLLPLLMAVQRGGGVAIASWVVAVFLAVLLHEIVHAVVARRAGFTPVIDLHGLGATTSWTSPFASAWGERLAIIVAGPVAGFVAAAAVAIVRSAVGADSLPSVIRLLLNDVFWASVGWSVLNVLPMLPLDGGQAFETILGLQQPGAYARRLSQTVSCGTAGLTALIALLMGLPFVALLCAVLAYDNAAHLYGLPTVHQRI